MADDRSRIEKLMAMAKQDASPRERDTARDILGKMGLWPEHDPRASLDDILARVVDYDATHGTDFGNLFTADRHVGDNTAENLRAFARGVYEVHFNGHDLNSNVRVHVTSIRPRRRATSRTTAANGFGPRPYVIYDEQA